MDGSRATGAAFSLVFVDRLGKALHEAHRIGGPWGAPCGYLAMGANRQFETFILVEYDEGPAGEFACLCSSMASHLIEIMERQYASDMSSL